ncbi:MAG: phenylalanine--tRNA ligase subunit beta [Candidatus Brocadiaceae bacterium]|jgi:phenylalanyl-tRNA synthetase beta chain
MKASYNWLRDYCEFDLPAHELAARLSHCGLGVESYEPRGDDWMLDVEVKTNRPDCLCHLGVAREVAAVTGGEARRPEFVLEEDPDRPFGQAASVEVAAPDLCPHYTARVISGVRIGPSPEWMQERLDTCGIRPINNVVDVTNYVMLEAGQPLHAFDLALLDESKIIVRRAGAGEVLITIDGQEHELVGEECVIADVSGPVALAGIMGGLESEIGDSTTDVLLEAARFDPRTTRRTSRTHAVASESSYRFERGIDPEITDWASRRACQLILELAGGRVLNGSADIRADAGADVTPEVSLRFARLKLVLGLEVRPDEAAQIFRSLGLAVLDLDETGVTVRVPSWRSDLTREVDLIEEVARIHGYERISETTDMPVRPVLPSVAELAGRRTRQLLAGEGFNEVMTYSLVLPTELQLSQPWYDGEPVGVRNPISAERTHLPLTNMANLLHVKHFNATRGTPRVDLFELGALYLPRAGEDTPEEMPCLTLLTDREDGLRFLKGVLANLLDSLGVAAEVEEEPEAAGPFGPAEALTLHMGDEMLGCAGVVAPEVAEELGLSNRPALLELDFSALVDRCRLSPPYRPVPAYPAAERDLAIVVEERVLWADIERCVLRNAPDVLESVGFFDLYRGQSIPSGRKSVAFSLTFRREDRTITSEEAEEARTTILSALERELGAELR